MDPKTGTEIVLIACMHFNPVSIRKAGDVASSLAASGRLGAVVVESCPTRWKRIVEMQPPGSPLRVVLDNEMQAAAEAAEAAGRPVVLGDMQVEQLAGEVSALAKVAMTDMISPLDGGWQRMASELFNGFRLLFNARQERKVAEEAQEVDNLGFQDIFDVELVLGIPVAVARYVGSMLFRAPAVLGAFVASSVVLAVLPEGLLTDILSFGFEAVLMRVMLGAVLKDRDATLARAIGEACVESGGPGRTVVAILGAAHCNGVKRHLIDAAST